MPKEPASVSRPPPCLPGDGLIQTLGTIGAAQPFGVETVRAIK